MRRWLTAPYRLIWRVLFDAAFGSQAQREERYEKALEVFEDPDELGYERVAPVAAIAYDHERGYPVVAGQTRAQQRERGELTSAPVPLPNPHCPVPGGSCLLCDDDHCREL